MISSIFSLAVDDIPKENYKISTLLLIYDISRLPTQEINRQYLPQMGPFPIRKVDTNNLSRLSAPLYTAFGLG
jgi:hypothetical protein